MRDPSDLYLLSDWANRLCQSKFGCTRLLKEVQEARSLDQAAPCLPFSLGALALRVWWGSAPEFTPPLRCSHTSKQLYETHGEVNRCRQFGGLRVLRVLDGARRPTQQGTPGLHPHVYCTFIYVVFSAGWNSLDVISRAWIEHQEIRLSPNTRCASLLRLKEWPKQNQPALL